MALSRVDFAPPETENPGMWQKFKAKRKRSQTQSGQTQSGQTQSGTQALSGTPALSGADWREQVGALCDSSMEAIGAEALARLRAGYTLLGRAPERDSALLQNLPTSTAFEAMLACEALESAALSLLPRGSSYLLSRGADDFCLASVVLPHTTEEVTAEGATPPLALLAALCASLVMPAGGSSRRGQSEWSLGDRELSDIGRLMLPEAHLLN